MSTCVCGSNGVHVSIEFEHGVSMKRCVRCETTAWLRGETEIEREVAFASLRMSFTEQRDRAPSTRALPAAARVLDLRERVAAGQPVELSDALGDLLAHRGLPGSWALSA